jgi:carbonic anhydrase/acetyltransferase-like protein (isoleucine patch superfamily)
MPILNDSSRPLILLGSRYAMAKIKRICQFRGITIHGIIDSDYYGNTDQVNGIAVIDTEESFEDFKKLCYYKENFNFFLVTTWTPEKTDSLIRTKQRRNQLISVIEKYQLNCISLSDQFSVVDSSATIGHSVLIDCFCMVEEGVTIGDYTSMYNHAGIGHHSSVGKSCVLQGKSGVMSDCIVEDDCYLGMCSELMRSVTLARGTVVHPGLVLHRSTVPDEVISLVGKDLRKIYNNKQIHD